MKTETIKSFMLDDEDHLLKQDNENSSAYEAKRQAIKLQSEYEDRILDLIDSSDDMTRSDLQGCVSDLVTDLIKTSN